MSLQTNAVTMADVARRAGVSIATVSRVLGNSRQVSESSRERVMGAATELGYSVNLLGRALRKQRSSAVGLLIPDLANPFFSALSAHLSTAFLGTETDLLIASSDNDVAVESAKVSSFLGRQVDALVVVPCHETDSGPAVALASKTCTTVQLDRRVHGLPVQFVGCHNFLGMAQIADHIAREVDTTAQPVYFVGAGQSSSSGHERGDGFVDAFDAIPHRGIIDGDFSFRSGQEAANQLLARGVSSATIVAAADVIALGALAVLQSAGTRVPDEFRVIGFDGIGVAPFAHPTLTTVRQPIEEMADAIVDMVSTRRSAPRTLRLTPHLLIGGSSPTRETRAECTDT